MKNVICTDCAHVKMCKFKEDFDTELAKVDCTNANFTFTAKCKHFCVYQDISKRTAFPNSAEKLNQIKTDIHVSDGDSLYDNCENNFKCEKTDCIGGCTMFYPKLH